MLCVSCGEKKLQRSFCMVPSCSSARLLCVCRDCRTHVVGAGSGMQKVPNEEEKLAVSSSVCPTLAALCTALQKVEQKVERTHEGRLSVRNILNHMAILEHVRVDDPVANVKKRIEGKLGVPVARQLLLYRGEDVLRPLHESKRSIASAVWGDLGVPFGADLKVLHRMHEARGEEITGGTLAFNLSWDMPGRHVIGRDRHMDGVCLVVTDSKYSGLTFAHVQPFQRSDVGILHGGQSVRDFTTLKHFQTLEVTLSALPRQVHALYFAVCSTGELHSFTGISVELSEVQGTSLAKVTNCAKVSPGSCRALMLCCARRQADSDSWATDYIGKDTHGFVSQRIGTDFSGLEQLARELEASYKM